MNKNYLWDTLEIDWKEVTVTFNDNKINLPRIGVVRLHHKIKVRRLMSREPLLFHVMIKQGITWFTEIPEIVNIKMYFQYLPEWSAYFSQSIAFYMATSDTNSQLKWEVKWEVKIISMQGTHIFSRDRMTQLIKCTPWSSRLHPHPTIVKKMRIFLEVKGKLGPIPQPSNNQYWPPQPDINPNVRKVNKAAEKRRRIVPTKRF